MSPDVDGSESVSDLVRRVGEEQAVLLEADGLTVVCLSYDAFLRLVAAGTAPRPAGAPATTPLSGREEEVLHLVGRGLSASEVSAALGISRNTTNQHLLSVRRKLGVRSTREAVRRWELGRERSP